MRAAARRAAERLLSAAGVPAVARIRVRRRTLVLAYHNIVPDGMPLVGDGSLHLPLSTFRAQLDHLTSVCRVVPLADLLAADGGDGPRAVLTLDDAYASALEVGASELARRGVPATIFVAPGCLGAPGFWWDRFATNDLAWPNELRRMLLTRHQGAEQRILQWAREAGLPGREPPGWQRVATAEELRVAVDGTGIAVGAHSWSHPNLAALDEAALRAEMVRPLEWLIQRFDRVVRWLAYPYGLSSPTVAKAAKAAGYAGAFKVSGGWLPRGAMGAYDLPRWNVPAGMSLAGFRLRLAGLFCR